MDKYKIFFQNKFAFTSFFLIVLHQTLIALSVVFLTKVITNFQENVSYTKNLIFYIICMIIPYIPGLISFIYLQKWINKSHKKYLNYVYTHNNLKPFDLKNLENIEKIDSLVSRNSFSIISSTLYFLHDFLTLFLNSFLSLIIFAILLPKQIFIGYSISFLFSFFIIFSTRNIFKNINYDVEKKMVFYGNFLNKFSYNFAINNDLNRNIWLEKSKEYGDSYYSSVTNSQIKRQLTNLVLALIAMLPTSYLIFSAITTSNNAAIIAAIIVNLTRIYNVLSSLNSVLSSMIEIPAISGRLKLLFDLNLENNINIKKLIKKISINNEYFKDLNSMYNYLLDQKTGRFTVRGENGSGKSVFLHEFKQKVKNNSILVPTNLNNLVWSKNLDLDRLSTGQKINSIINSIKDSDYKYLLLDEWDANLDGKNKEEIDNLLDKLSKNKVVIEIRH